MNWARSLISILLVGLGGLLIVGAVWVGLIGFGTSYEIMYGPQGPGMYEVKRVAPGAGIALGLSGLALIGYGILSSAATDEETTKIITINNTDNNEH